MELMEQIIARAKSCKQRIVLPESLEERTLTAADKALADDLADIILIGKPSEIFALAENLGLKHIDKATIIDPETNEKTETSKSETTKKQTENRLACRQSAEQAILQPHKLLSSDRCSRAGTQSVGNDRLGFLNNY